MFKIDGAIINKISTEQVDDAAVTDGKKSPLPSIADAAGENIFHVA